MKWEIPVSGMHCRSCELLLEGAIKEVPGVNSVKANFQKGQIDVHFGDLKPAWDKVKQKIIEAGYKLGQSSKRTWLANDGKTYGQLILAGLIVLVIYWLIKLSGIGSFALGGNNVSYPFIILVGVVAGLSTCMAVVGGLVLAFAANFSELHPNLSWQKKLQPHFFFNLGRIVGYGLLGGLLGLVGDVFNFSNTWWAIVSIVVAIVMLFLGLKLTEISPRLASWSLTMPKFISKLFYKDPSQKSYSHLSAIIGGALTFFLPCGFTQAMQILALGSGSFWTGATIMALFALGTVPALFGLGWLTSVFSGKRGQLFFKVVGVGVIILALINFSSGLKLLGWSGFSSASDNNQVGSAQDWQMQVANSGVIIQNGVQIVNMTESARGYAPNQFVVKKGMPVKWVVNAQDTFTCASSLLLPQMNIQKYLQSGENIIEFTPTKVGRMRFSCSMGMFGGEFNVIE